MTRQSRKAQAPTAHVEAADAGLAWVRWRATETGFFLRPGGGPVGTHPRRGRGSLGTGKNRGRKKSGQKGVEKNPALDRTERDRGVPAPGGGGGRTGPIPPPHGEGSPTLKRGLDGKPSKERIFTGRPGPCGEIVSFVAHLADTWPGSWSRIHD